MSNKSSLGPYIEWDRETSFKMMSEVLVPENNVIYCIPKYVRTYSGLFTNLWYHLSLSSKYPVGFGILFDKIRKNRDRLANGDELFEYAASASERLMIISLYCLQINTLMEKSIDENIRFCLSALLHPFVMTVKSIIDNMFWLIYYGYRFPTLKKYEISINFRHTLDPDRAIHREFARILERKDTNLYKELNENDLQLWLCDITKYRDAIAHRHVVHTIIFTYEKDDVTKTIVGVPHEPEMFTQILDKNEFRKKLLEIDKRGDEPLINPNKFCRKNFDNLAKMMSVVGYRLSAKL